MTIRLIKLLHSNPGAGGRGVSCAVSRGFAGVLGASFGGVSWGFLRVS